jgi:hypothetical protein
LIGRRPDAACGAGEDDGAEPTGAAEEIGITGVEGVVDDGDGGVTGGTEIGGTAICAGGVGLGGSAADGTAGAARCGEIGVTRGVAAGVTRGDGAGVARCGVGGVCLIGADAGDDG